MSLHVTELQVSNLGGVLSFKAKLRPHINIVVGENGSGKTSLKDAIVFAFAGGNKPDLLHTGSEEGFVSVTFNHGYRELKTLKPGGFTIEVFTPEGGVQKAPTTFIEQIISQQSFSIDEFINLKLEEKLEYLLTTMPIVFSAQELNDCLNATPEKVKSIAITDRARAFIKADKRLDSTTEWVNSMEEPFDLDKWDTIYKRRKTQATNINRVRDEVNASFSMLQKTMIDDDHVDWVKSRDGLEKELSGVQVQIATAQSEVKATFTKIRQDYRDQFTLEQAEFKNLGRAFVAELQGAVEAAAAALENGVWDAERTERITEQEVLFNIAVNAAVQRKADYDAFMAKAAEDESAQLMARTGELEQERSRLSEELGQARAKSAEQLRRAGVRAALAEHEEKLAALTADEETVRHSIKMLEELRVLKLRALTIPGFDVSYEKVGKSDRKKVSVTIDGVPFDSLNAQQQIYLAVRCLRLSKPELPILIFESAELDMVHFKALVLRLEELGAQVLTPRWVDGAELAVVGMDEYLELVEEAKQRGRG